jgi:dTDP-4-amino-4,6-dideoxygalactose transaminase
MLTGAPDLVERAKSFSLHGMSRNAWNRYGAGGSWFYDVLVPGFKYNMSDLQAAIGLAQLSRIGQLQQRRKAIFDAYDQAFGGIGSLNTPTRRNNVDHALHLYVLRLKDQTNAKLRDSLIEDLKARGIGASVHFIPIHLHSYYRETYGYKPEDFPVAYSNYQRMLSLPLSPALNDSQIQRVIDTVCELVPQSRRLAG